MSRISVRGFSFAAAVMMLSGILAAQTKPRARDLGVPFDGTTGANNAITDVKGVEVGHTTLISGEGKLEIGKGPVRTGVTAIHPLDVAHTGPVEEGNVGGGTGMICNEFKGGIGTSSRVLDQKAGGYTVGVLVQCNYGAREQLRIAGINVGREIPERTVWQKDIGSIIVVVATDAPLIPTQLKRIAKKVSLGLGRDGSYSGEGSGG